MSVERKAEKTIPDSDFNLFSALDGHAAELEKLRWKGTFSEYVDMVAERPYLARTSHKTLFDMITRPGVEILPDGTKKYPFFETGENAIYGSEKPLANLVGILEAAAHGLEPRKRILLLMGPPGGGKSTIVTALKRGLEEFSMTNEGAIYAIDGCLMNEEPLHLIPRELRTKFEQNFGLHIEGDLCPQCQAKYSDPLVLKNVQIKRVFFSEKNRVGIGTFMPSDPKSQDMSELVGSVDFSKLAQHGSASDPNAYRFDGELNVANRGLMEFVEMLKSDERFLYILLSLAQEQVIKTGRFANISADEVVISHTNQGEYDKFVTEPKFAALRDRTLVVPVPYNLRVSDEARIYAKLISQGDLTKAAEGKKALNHINPHTLRVAATFAVLTRLEKSKKGVDPKKKLKIYDGETIDGVSLKDAKDLREEFPNEGMSGISPRYVIDSLSSALVKGTKNCLTPIDALRALREGLDSHPHTRDMPQDKKENIRNLISDARGEYDEMAKREVQAAFINAFSDSAQTVFDNYITNIVAFCNKVKIKDPITEEEKEADEKIMRPIEEAIGIGESGKKDFREEILRRIGTVAAQGHRFSYSSHPRLKEGIENKLFDDLKDIVKLTTTVINPDEQQKDRIERVTARLVDEKGYCTTCANEMLRYVGQLIDR
ncbi:MAG: protein prkA [bacterium]|nr:protein prkA [bacterium]